jgi:hypothetical protein
VVPDSITAPIIGQWWTPGLLLTKHNNKPATSAPSAESVVAKPKRYPTPATSQQCRWSVSCANFQVYSSTYNKPDADAGGAPGKDHDFMSNGAGGYYGTTPIRDSNRAAHLPATEIRA